MGTHSMKRVLLCLLLFSSTPGRSQDSYAGSSMEIPIGARALALGGTFAGLADDPTGFRSNPAGVSLMEHKTLGMMYSSEYGAPGNGLADLWYAGFVLPLK